MNITPLGDRVIVEPFKADNKTAGGIIIPDKAKEKPNKGVVVAAAENLTVSKGDNILYSPNSGTPYNHAGKDYLILKESDIWGKLSIN